MTTPYALAHSASATASRRGRALLENRFAIINVWRPIRGPCRVAVGGVRRAELRRTISSPAT